MALKYAAALGGVILDDSTELTTALLTKREIYIKQQASKNNCFKGVAKRSSLKGSEITFCWARGHLVNLYQASDYDIKYKKWSNDNFPFFPKEFKNKVIDDQYGGTYAKKQFSYLKGLLIQKFDFCINGCDSDREAILIFDRVFELSNSKMPTKRLFLNSTKEEDIIKEFSNLREPNQHLSDAAKGRAYADWSYGINFTVLFSLKNNVLSPIGRIKLPTLKLIADRYNESINFKPQKYYMLSAYIKKGNEIVKFTLDDKYNDRKKLEELKNKIINVPGVVTNIENETEKEPAPIFYSLSRIQAEANNLYGYTLSKTLELVQGLYDKSYLTYPRTDSTVIPVSEESNMPTRIDYIDEGFKVFKDIALNNISKGMKLGNRHVKDTGSPHFAIIINNKAGKLTSDEKNIYELVSKSILAPFLGPATWNNDTVTINIGGVDFIAKGKVLDKKGFRALIPVKKNILQLPKFCVNEQLIIDSIKIEDKETKPRPLFTDSTLVTAMANIKNIVDEKEYKDILTECKGIGTEATRANLLESLINDAKYVLREKKNLIPTELGIHVITNFPVEELKSPITTAKWEMRLNNIENGKESLSNMLRDIEKDIIANSIIIKNMVSLNLGTPRETIGKCPICGGNVIEGKKGFGCSNWKEKNCKFVIWNTIAAKKISKTQVKKLLSKGESDYIEGFKSKKDSLFGAYLLLNKEDYTINFKFKDRSENKTKDKVVNNHTSSSKTLGKCPLCGGGIVDKQYSYNCTNCALKISKLIAGHTIIDEELQDLLEFKVTKKLNGFLSKTKKKFSCKLILNKDKIEFKF